MSLNQRIRSSQDLTPTEQQLARTVLALGPRLESMTIQELALASNASVASVHRFCKKLGLEGFKQLKVEVARASARRSLTGDVDIDFPFSAGEPPETIARRMELLYEATLRETRELLDAKALADAAELVRNARTVLVYTQSHNLYPAQMFCDRLLSSGKGAACHADHERQVRSALAAEPQDVAVAISYSGLSPSLAVDLPILAERGVPTILVGTPNARRLHPGLRCYLEVSDSESLNNRITQFASHISVQYVLDVLYGAYFALDYEKRLSFLKGSLPYTALPNSSSAPLS